MSRVLDPARRRFGGWTTEPNLPPSTRDPRVKATDFADDYLKELIVTLQLPPLTVVTESEVATAIAVSRTPVREAFLRLSAERLLEYVPRRGAMVPAITLRSIREQAETRVVMEGYGVDWICEHRVPVAPDLYELVEQQAAVNPDEPGAIPHMVAIDKEFHWTLVKATGNTEFARLYNSLHDRQLRTGIAMFTAVPNRPHTAVDHHRAIADAIAEFDRDRAQALLKHHIIESLDEVARVFTD